MCIICYIPKDMELAEKYIFEAMWYNNPDGAGIMWQQDNVVRYKKGYFNFNDFYNDVVKIKNTNVNMAIHCRIATSGGINSEMCHPFKISNKDEELKETYNECEIALMHNGIIRGLGYKYSGMSDTAEYIKDTLYPRYKKDKTFYLDTETISNEITGSRLIFMTSKTVRMIGQWYKIDGCYYSNLRF